MSSIILGLFMSLGAAEAGELSWRWEGEQRFRSELVIETPLSFTYIGAANLEARAVQTVIAAEYRCTPTAVKKGWELDCAYTRVEMKGKALGKEQEKLNAIFAEYQRLLSSAHLQIQVRPDGGMRDLDLEGVAKTNARQAEVQEILRMLSRRVVLPLFVSTPKDGVDPGKAWKHSGFHPAFELLDLASTTGGVVLETQVSKQVAGTWLLTSQGRGSVATQIEVEGGLGASTMMQVAGESRFDPKLGMVVYSEFLTVGNRLSSTAQVGDPRRYSCGGWVGRLREDGTVEALEGTLKLSP